MKRKANAWLIVVLALVGIGIVYQLFQRPTDMIIPVVVLGGIFLLYKFVPNRSKAKPKTKVKASPRTARPSARASSRTKPQRKAAPFRVIEGGKDDDSMPKYH